MTFGFIVKETISIKRFINKIIFKKAIRSLLLHINNKISNT